MNNCTAEPRHPSENAWWVSRLMVFWITPLIQLASVQSLTEKDIWPCPKDKDIEYSTKVVRNAWSDEQKNNRENPSLLRALLRGFGGTFLLSGCYQFTFLCTQLAQPFLVGELVSFVATGNGGLRQGVGLAFALAAVSLSSSILLAAGLYTNRLLGVSLKAGVMMTVYEQALHLTTAARMQSSVGQTTNLVSIDSEKLFQAVLFCHFIWHGPVCCIVVMGILISQVGLAALVGLGFIFVLIPVQNWMAEQIGVVRRKMVKLTDERVKLINEFLHAIRVVKYYAWEVPIEERVQCIREKEITMLTAYLSSAGRLRELLFSAQPIAALLIFTTALYGFNRALTVVELFRLLAFLNITRFPLNLLGQALKSFNDAQVSLQRLDRFLLLPTLPTHTSEVAPTPNIAIHDATFSWVGEVDSSGTGRHDSGTPAQDKDVEAAGAHVYFSLKSITFSPLKANELVAIVGSVGSGKSSFLAALLKEMPLISGACETSGSISYCAQTPWIQNMTLRNNVLFGCDLEATSNDHHLKFMYDRALTAAALRPDLKILPSGDETEIGEKGINLSGGQKSRVSIARALFSCHRSQIYLLDDPFSAVDGATGNWIFKHGLLDMLQDKLRIVALNSHLHLLKHFDRIIILEDGHIAALGTPAEITSSYPDIMERVTGISNSDQQDTAPIAHAISLSNLTLVDASDEGPGDESKDSIASDITDKEQVDSKPIEESTIIPTNSSVMAVGTPVSTTKSGNLTEKEKMAAGKTSFATYLKYFSASLMTIPPNKNGENLFYYESANLTFSSRQQYFYGLLIVLGILFVFSFSQVARIAVDYLLARWAAAGAIKDSSDAIIYYCSVGVLLLSLCVRSVYLNKFASWSSMQIHATVLRHVLSAPIPTFFDTRTIGEILNRFSKDMETVDSSVPEFMLQVLINWAQVFSIFALCISVTPYFILAMLPLGIGFYKMYNYFASASRDLKRLESITRSPIFSSLSETLTGLETIRAYGDTMRFETAHRLRMERNNKIFFHLWCCMSWVTARLEIATSLILFSIAILAVCLRESVSPISLGLALSFGLQLTALFQRCVQVSIDVSTYMTSTERLFEYTDIPQERSVSTPHPTEEHDFGVVEKDTSTTPDAGKGKGPHSYQQLMSDEAYTYTDWPQNGRLVFENVWMAYRNGPPVLRGVNVVVESGQRIGICGRTGAGKSSIMAALFRIVELTSGKITYDGVDVSQIPLQRLRQNLAIIPQDPVLLMGSIRFQLDPFAQHSDEEVWDSLTQVNLAATVRLFPKGIHEEVKENAENLSQGQKQLLCIARALLRRTQILVVDEGTSAVDPQTDAQIQTVLREQAQKRDTTVLAIAHRLQTIIDFDKILVLGNGEVHEFDSPEVLLANLDSAFSSMVRESKQ